MHLTSLAEFELVALKEGASDGQHGTGQFGEYFASAINEHSPRKGVNPGATMQPESGWCKLFHFNAERMVMQYHERQTQGHAEASQVF